MRLRVRFAPPGWFWNSPRLVVRLDGTPLIDGSFVGGFDVTTEVAPGPHTLATAIHVTTTLARHRVYTVEVPPPSPGAEAEPRLEARLGYSRLWGNFHRQLEFVRVHERVRPQG